jgi:4'-phosphopantetheinyl transferase
MVDTLSQGHIHVWHARVSDVGDDQALWAEYGQWLSAEERAREQRFHQIRDQRRYRLSRALLRWALSQHVEVPPPSWVFQSDKHGRPYIVHEAPTFRGLQFNLSHTHEHVVLAVRRGGLVGVDVEGGRTVAGSLTLADQFFAPSEVAALRALPTALQEQRFLALWTLKEAYVKARGLGLSIPLDRFGFEFAQAPADDPCQLLRWWAAGDIDPEPESWQFWQGGLGQGVQISLCAHASKAELRPVWHTVLPGRSEETQSAPWWQTSL